MKIYNKFVESKNEPSNKNDIWFDGSTVRLYKEGEWYTVTLSKEAIERLLQYAENVDIFKYVNELPDVGDFTFIYFKKEESNGNLIVLPYVYDGEWKQITNTEIFSESSPFGFGEVENSAVLKGGNNEAINANEVALGKYNKSNKDTQFSIGIGTSESARKNAFEVKQNGDIYIEGVEGRIQDRLNTNIDSALSDTSTNPVQNKAIVAALATKTNENDVKELIALEHIYFLYKADENKLYFKGLDALDNWRLVLPIILNITFGKPLIPHLSIATNDGTINISTNDFEINVSMGEYNMTWSYNGKKFSLVFDESGSGEQIITSQDIDYVTAQQLTELSAEVSGLSERIENLPSGESDVFKAIYGTTTYEEVSEAYNQGKIIHCDYESRCYELAVFTGNTAWFSALNTTTSYLLMLNADSSWSKASYGLENAGNRVDTIQADAKPYQYPSAKAVYDALQNVGGGASSDKQGVIRQTQKWTQAADNGYDYVMQDIVRGAIPQANIDLFTSAGAVFNEESGYFELNGLTDISYEEMINIHNYTIPFSIGVIAPQGVMLGRSLPIRTPYALKAKRFYIFSSGNWDYLFWDSKVERVKITEPIALGSLNTAFSLSKYLSDIDGVISLESGPSTSNIFGNCWNLRSIQFTKLKVSIEIKQSPRLTNASILYMIQNEIATSAIVITLHADAYARAMADAEILAALEAHPNVSLASA